MKEHSTVYDLLIVGGGINGCGIAADAAGRGLNVLLCEQHDLGSGTSSASTKLVHGGLRYLEYYEFSLVRQALAEREVLLNAAPHIVWPMRFRLPHNRSLRPRWMIRSGLFLYDHLSRRNSLPASRSLHFSPEGPLRPELRRGFEYSDCWVDDSRLVVLNAMQAAEKGACVKTRTRCEQLRPGKEGWTASLRDQSSDESYDVTAKAVVNAAGPWVSQLAAECLPGDGGSAVRLVKGSHIVVPRMHEHPEAYMLQNDDRRIVFVIPYEDDFTLIGTTEEDFSGDPSTATASDSEVDYLLDVVNRHFRQQLDRSDIVHRFSGVRPLLEGESDDSSALSRDYTLELDREPAPILTVYGGKITTYRRLAEAALNKLAPLFPAATGAWTEKATLPGGDFADQSTLCARVLETYAWLPQSLLRRWLRSYGTRTWKILGEAASLDDLGQHWGAGLYDCELRYLLQHEWAQTAEDVLWRRSKLGLHFDSPSREALVERIQTELAAESCKPVAKAL